MKRLIQLTFVITGILIGIWSLSRKQGSQQEGEKSPHIEQTLYPSSDNVPSVPSRLPLLQQTKLQPDFSSIHAIKLQPNFPPATGGEKPIGNKVSFRMVEGYAVAFGDILLGKPDGPIAGDRGTYDAPQPRYWEQVSIAYGISPDLPNPERVEKALTYLRLKTPINFVPYSGQQDGILFEPAEKHCLSLLGKVGGIQPIKLAPGCQWQEVLHEILHALGFVHEQSRADRDEYVEILWENIDEQYRDQFAVVPDSFLELVHSFPFDYHSVMLYHTDAFVLKPDLPNMRSKGSEPIEPTRDGLSEGDIRRLNRIFRGYE